MAEHCECHSDITQKIGEFSAKLEHIIAQVATLHSNMIAGVQSNERLLTDQKHLGQGLTDLKESFEALREDYHNLTKLTFQQLSDKFTVLEKTVTKIDNAYAVKVDVEHHDTERYNGIMKSLDSKAAKGELEDMKSFIYKGGLLTIVVSLILKYLIP